MKLIETTSTYSEIVVTHTYTHVKMNVPSYISLQYYRFVNLVDIAEGLKLFLTVSNDPT
jgi:hypothetical protein